MQKKTAGLNEVFKLYLFTRALPGLVSTLAELLSSCSSNSSENMDDNSSGQPGLSAEKLADITKTMRAKFITPLESLAAQFLMYQNLIELVIDLDQLPILTINPKHDPELQELRDEQITLEKQAEKLRNNASNSWASFANINLEISPQHGFIFRSTSGDDERQLRANNPSVRVISIKKVC